MSTLIQSEQERRAKERRNGGSNLRVQTPAEAQDPVVAPNNLPTPAQGSGSASDFSVSTPQPRQQQAAPTPRRRPDGLPDLVTSQTIQPTQRMAGDTPNALRTAEKAETPTTRTPAVSGVERPEEMGFWGGFFRDRVREGLTDEDGDGRYEVPFWTGLTNDWMPFRGADAPSSREIADRQRARDRDAQARGIARESGVMDELGIRDDRLYDPDDVKGAAQAITRRREQGEGQTTRTQELDVIDRNNVPLIEQTRSGERIADGDRTANVGMNRDNNQTTLTVSDREQGTIRRGQDIDSSLTLAGYESDLDLAELQRAAAQDQLTAQNALATQQYQQQLAMYRMERDDRKAERDEDRRMDSLSALMAGLASLGASFAL